jgi:hypothetical protein
MEVINKCIVLCISPSPRSSGVNVFNFSDLSVLFIKLCNVQTFTQNDSGFFKFQLISLINLHIIAG